MFKINTFIKKPNIQYDILNQANEDPNNSFVNITNITEFENIKNDLDLDYIDGAITIEYVDRLIMDFSLWDLVDQLWAYLINLIEEVIKQGYAITYFPDQPVKLELKVILNDLLLFTIDEGKVFKDTLPMTDFINKLLKGAEDFFNHLNHYFRGSVNYNFELNKIKNIQKHLKEGDVGIE